MYRLLRQITLPQEMQKVSTIGLGAQFLYLGHIEPSLHGPILDTRPYDEDHYIALTADPTGYRLLKVNRRGEVVDELAGLFEGDAHNAPVNITGVLGAQVTVISPSRICLADLNRRTVDYIEQLDIELGPPGIRRVPGSSLTKQLSHLHDGTQVSTYRIEFSNAGDRVSCQFFGSDESHLVYSLVCDGDVGVHLYTAHNELIPRCEQMVRSLTTLIEVEGEISALHSYYSRSDILVAAIAGEAVTFYHYRAVR